MSGQAAARGYLLQALVCVLDSFDEDNQWVAVTVEPNELSEHVDILWCYAEHKKVVQVKSSQNRIGYARAKQWATLLEATVDARLYELRLIGECDSRVSRCSRIGQVEIPPPERLNLKAIRLQAAHKLDCYLAKKRPSRSMRPAVREMIIEALSHRLGEMSTRGESLSRQGFDDLLMHWIHEVSKTNCTTFLDDDSGIADLDAYCQRFDQYYSDHLPALVGIPLTIDGVQSQSQDLLDFLCRSEHGQIIGPSGYGKSLLLGHMAVHATNRGYVPVLAKAIDYDGNLEGMLDRCVQAFCSCRWAALSDAVRSSGRTLVLVIDGVNECQQSLCDKLLLQLQACYLRWNIPVILSSQAMVAAPPELKGRIIEVCDLDVSQRHKILLAYHDGELPSNADDICRGLRSAYELSIAGSCLETIAEHPNRAGLFDAYVRDRACRTGDAAVLRRVMVAIAHVTRLELRSSLSLSHVERMTEEILERNGVPLTQVERVLRAGFLDIDGGLCRFRHELLQRFFEATDLASSNPVWDVFAAELLKPPHHALIEFILGMERSVPRIRELLRIISHLPVSVQMFRACFLGHFGQSVRALLVKDVDRLFSVAVEDLQVLTFSVTEKTATERRSPVIIIENVRVWDSFDRALWNAIAGMVSEGIFLDQSLDLLAATEAAINEGLEPVVGGKQAWRNKAFSDVFVLGLQNHKLPSHWLNQGAQSYSPNRNVTLPQSILADRIASQKAMSNYEMYFLLQMSHGRSHALEKHVPEIVRRGWSSRLYHLRLEVLQFVQSWANPAYEGVSLGPETRAEVEDLLVSLKTDNPFLSTALAESLSSFDLIDPGITAQDVRSQLLLALSEPDTVDAQNIAAAAVSNIFEDVFDGVYYEAIDGLSDSEKTSIYAMAGLSVPSYSWTASYVIERLLESPSRDALKVFERFATEFDDATCFQQDTARCFISAHVGCAALCEVPFSLSDLRNEDRKALQCYGEMFFWMAKCGSSSTEALKQCAPLWARLSSELWHAAVDPLIWFASSNKFCWDGRARWPVDCLFVTFKSEIRDLLELCLAKREDLTWLDKRKHASHARRELITFMLHTLGQVGCHSTLPLLMLFIDDEYHGETAVEAVRTINAGGEFRSLTILRRFP